MRQGNVTFVVINWTDRVGQNPDEEMVGVIVHLGMDVSMFMKNVLKRKRMHI
jgi:hypothetical protein